MSEGYTPKVKEADPPKRIELFQYSLLALPLAFAGLPLYVHAPDFYTRHLGVDVGLIAIILLIIRSFDAIQDPYIGYLSDKHAQKRFLIMSLGVVLLMCGMGGVFFGPLLPIPVWLWFSLAMIMATTGFSIVTINLNMIGGFWHSDKEQRTRISAWREASALAGLLIAVILPAVFQQFKPAEIAFRLLFGVFCIIMVTGFVMFSRFMRRITPGHLITQKTEMKGLSFFKILAGSEWRFFLTCFLTHVAASLPGVMVLYFIIDYLDAAEYQGLFLSLYFVSGALLMPFWVKLARKIGKEKAWLLSMLLAIATFIWAAFLNTGDIWPYAIICVLSGMSLGADLALPPSILADKVEAQNKESEATQNYALLAFIPKMGIAISSGVSLLILDSFGFQPGEVNTEIAKNGLLIMYAVIPCGFKLASAALLWTTIRRTEYK